MLQFVELIRIPKFSGFRFTCLIPIIFSISGMQHLHKIKKEGNISNETTLLNYEV